MATNLWPTDAVSGGPSYTGQMLREMVNGHLGPKTTARPLGARTGVWPGTPAGTVATSGTGPVTLTVNPHGGVLDLETPAASGPYTYAVDAAWTTTLTAASSSDQRVDSVFVQMSDPAAGDGSSVPAATLIYTAGTAGPAGGGRGGSGGPPNIPARAFELAQIQVPKSGTGSPSVSFVAPFVASAGGVIPVRSQAERDAISAYDGLVVARQDTDVLEQYTGSAWKTFAAFAATAIQVTNAASVTVTPASTDVPITSYDGGVQYTVGDPTYSAGVITAHTAGIYRWAASVSWATLSAGGFRVEQFIYKNGVATGIGKASFQAVAGSGVQFLPSGGDIQLAAGDTVQLVLQASTSGVAGVVPAAFSLHRVA